MVRYKFIAGCPACGDRERGLWHHENCSSYEEIDEDGYIYCRGCSSYLGVIMDLKSTSGLHSYKSVQDPTSVFQALAMMTDAQKDIPKDFAEKISVRILKRLSSR